MEREENQNVQHPQENQELPSVSDESVEKQQSDITEPGEASTTSEAIQNSSQQQHLTGSNTIKASVAEEAEQENSKVESMEVHHHGHVHHEKKWKEYLFQFLMLFLAVFCGTLDLELGNDTRDHVINKISVKEQRILITKDSDFLDSLMLKNEPYKVRLVKLGNTSKELIQFFQVQLGI